MERNIFKKIAIGWALLTIALFILAIVGLKGVTSIILLAVAFISTIIYRFFILFYSPEWDFWYLECPKCGFKWKPRWIVGVEYISTSPYDFFHPAFLVKKLKPPFFIRCSRCRKFSWCKYKVVREVIKKRTFSIQIILVFLIIFIFILITFACWNLFKAIEIFNRLNNYSK